MRPFLQCIADGYIDKYVNVRAREKGSLVNVDGRVEDGDSDKKGLKSGESGNVDLSDICFVFPNKRAGTFFRKYLRQALKGVYLMPEITNITEFVTLVSGRQIGTRLEMLLLLYKCYLEELAPGVPQSELDESLRFDNFRVWGDTVLRDFSDVDLHCIDAEEIFTNLKDFRTLATDYLNDNQRRVVEEYFGKHLYEQSDSFWRQFEDVDEISDGKEEGDSEGVPPRRKARKKFVYLWQLLSSLCRRFEASLSAIGQATTGMAYRLAKERLEQYGAEILPWKRVVMVGFNALSGAERGIFSALQDLEVESSGTDKSIPEPYADFVWDCTGPILRDRENPAGRFVAINKKRYPEPEWLKEYLRKSDTTTLPYHLEKIACPSNALQAKVAGEELVKMHNELGEEAFAEARVAVVVPDESLLMPILYGLPPEVGNVNLTMGYPLKETSISTFITLLRSVQSSQRYSRGERGFGIEELNRLFSHPLSHAILGTSTINRFRSEMASKRRIVVGAEDIKSLSSRGERMLRILGSEASVEETSNYMNDVLEMVIEAMSSSHGTMIHNKLESANARKWQQALRLLTDSLQRYDIEMRPLTLMYEAERLLSAETVGFRGEPLAGLQIMGLLETRLLDFDHIIILSMNDKIMPQKSRQRTFIPDTLRWGYGMPPSNYQENIFSYYFYRLISRAKSVRMLYDSRIGISGGGPSRYLHQLDMLYARESLMRSERKVVVTNGSEYSEASGHNVETYRKLRRYLAESDGGRSFSATSLKKYCVCPLKFYLEVICGIKTDYEESEKLGAIEYGNIFHSLMEHMYLPADHIGNNNLFDKPVRIHADKIRKLLEDRDRLMSEVVRAINKHYYRRDESDLDMALPPATAIIAEGMLLQLESTLRYDLGLTPFDILGCETAGDVIYDAGDDLRVRMQFKIDRIDLVPTGDDESGNPIYEYRLVDYKTGYVSYDSTSFDDYFVNMNNSDPTFQMMLYAELLSSWERWQSRYGHPKLGLSIYAVNSPQRVNEIRVPQINKETIGYYDEVREEFNERLRAMLHEIYIEDKEFEAMPEEKKCSYCSFRAICRK